MKQTFLFIVAILFAIVGCDTRAIDDFDHAQVIHQSGKKYDYMVIASGDTFLRCPSCSIGWYQWPSMRSTANTEIDMELDAAVKRIDAKRDMDNKQDIDSTTSPIFKP